MQIISTVLSLSPAPPGADTAEGPGQQPGQPPSSRSHWPAVARTAAGSPTPRLPGLARGAHPEPTPLRAPWGWKQGARAPAAPKDGSLRKPGGRARASELCWRCGHLRLHARAELRRQQGVSSARTGRRSAGHFPGCSALAGALGPTPQKGLCARQPGTPRVPPARPPSSASSSHLHPLAGPADNSSFIPLVGTRLLETTISCLKIHPQDILGKF